MTVTLYQSTDASAPALNNTAKSWLNVISGIAVTGYGIMPGAGWSAPFADGAAPNRRVWVPGGGPTKYFRAREQAAGGDTTWWDAWETMSDVDTGTNQWATDVSADAFPSAAGANRPWIAVADASTITIMTDLYNTGQYGLYHFGAFYSYVGSADLYRSITWLAGRATPGFGQALSVASLGTRLNREAGGTDVGIDGSLGVDNQKCLIAPGASFISQGRMPYPNPADSKTWISPIYVGDVGYGPTIRGKLRGVHAWCHPIGGVADRDTFSIGARTFIIVKLGITNGFGQQCLFVLETSSTWPDN